MDRARDASLLTGQALVANIDLAGRIIANQNGGQLRRQLMLIAKAPSLALDIAPQRLGDFLAV